MKTPNEIIAEYHGWIHQPSKKGKGKGLWNFPSWNKAAFNSDFFQYDTIGWLYPVYIKLRKELTQVIGDNVNKGASAHWVMGKAGTVKASIELALLDGDIHALHAEIVKGINFINEQKK